MTGAGELVELGAGASDKARVLLDAMRGAGTLRRYIPLDVSQSVVEDAARTLIEDYEGLQVYGVVGDFERHLEHVPDDGRVGGNRLVALLGGTIGNFPPGTRRNVLAKIATLLGPDDRLLLGTDLVKDPHVIEAAYNDAAGITAEFNRNLLHVLNRELHADFQPESFEHIAFYDRRNEWVEMRLRATRACVGLHRRPRPARRVRRRRGAAHRDQRQVHPRPHRDRPRGRGPGARALVHRRGGPVRGDDGAASRRRLRVGFAAMRIDGSARWSRAAPQGSERRRSANCTAPEPTW